MNVDKNDIIYLDKSGFDMNIKKEYGWKTRGERLFDNKSGSRKGKRIIVISAYWDQTKKLMAPMYFEGGNTNTEVFNLWIKEFLLPKLKPNQVVVMDNAAFHKSDKTRKLIEDTGVKLLYLPPYSPDLNPIEQKWSHVKNIVKKVRDRFNSFEGCLDWVLSC